MGSTNAAKEPSVKYYFQMEYTSTLSYIFAMIEFESQNTDLFHIGQ